MFANKRYLSSLTITHIPIRVVGESFFLIMCNLIFGSRTNSVIHRFSISGSHIVPRAFIRDPLVIDDIQRREARCRQSGGIGACVVVIQCGTISQVMPVEVDPPSKISWDTREDWADVLSHFVESGRTDFKPISTTSRG
jgi:hypothetical protein